MGSRNCNLPFVFCPSRSQSAGGTTGQALAAGKLFGIDVRLCKLADAIAVLQMANEGEPVDNWCNMAGAQSLLVVQRLACHVGDLKSACCAGDYDGGGTMRGLLDLASLTTVGAGDRHCLSAKEELICQATDCRLAWSRTFMAWYSR